MGGQTKMAALLDEKRDLLKLPRLNKRFTRIIVVAILLFVFLSASLPRGTDLVLRAALKDGFYGQIRPFSSIKSQFSPASIDPKGKSVSQLCATFPSHMLDKIQPVLKMGHGEDHNKIEAQLSSCSACFRPSELLIYSDLEETIKGYQVTDILATLPSEYYDVDSNPDMKHYFKQKEMSADGTLDKDVEETKSIDGWAMDKYKFLAMVEQAWKTKPNRDFYFFYETDTYVFWDNAFRFLEAFDPDVPLYMGSPTPGRVDETSDYKSSFANGGPGFVLSRGAIKTLLDRKVGPEGQFTQAPLIDRWLPLLREDCCGDSVMGWTLYHANVTLQGYWPLFNPHPLHSIPYSDLYWCQPVMTLHKTLPKDMVDLWRWEFGQRQSKRPMLYSDVWRFQHPGKPDILDDWDNGEWDSWRPAPEDEVDSFEKCAAFCEAHDECVQYSWHGRDDAQCLAMKSIRYGGPRQPEQMSKSGTVKAGAAAAAAYIFHKTTKPPDSWVEYKAGWMESRIDQWMADRRCEIPGWVGPSLDRIY